MRRDWSAASLVGHGSSAAAWPLAAGRSSDQVDTWRRAAFEADETKNDVPLEFEVRAALADRLKAYRNESLLR
jgi:hypothetical protein